MELPQSMLTMVTMTRVGSENGTERAPREAKTEKAAVASQAKKEMVRMEAFEARDMTRQKIARLVGMLPCVLIAMLLSNCRLVAMLPCVLIAMLLSHCP